MIPGAFLILVVPLAVAGIGYILGQWRRLTGLLATVTAFMMGLAIATLPLDRPVAFWGGREIAMGEAVDILGRELGFTPSARWSMAFIFFAAAGIFLVAWAVHAHSLLYSIGLGSLSLLCTALLIRPLIYAALLVEIVAILSVFALQKEGQSPSRGAIQFLTFSILALPGLLVTHWLLERYALTPNETSLLSAAAILLALSFALLLGILPFHTWVTGITRDSMPFSSTFVLTIGQSTVWFILFAFLETYPWLTTYLRHNPAVLTLGVTMSAVGGVLAAGQRRLGTLMGYAVLADTGCILVAFGIDASSSLSLMLLALLVRPIGLTLMAAGSAKLTDWGLNDSSDKLKGLGWKHPLSTGVYIVGGMSLAGMPITAGFVWRWALYRSVAVQNVGQAFLLLLSSCGVVAGLLRAATLLLDYSGKSDVPSATITFRVWEWSTTAIVVLATLGCIGVGLWPQRIAPLATQIAASFTLLVK